MSFKRTYLRLWQDPKAIFVRGDSLDISTSAAAFVVVVMRASNRMIRRGVVCMVKMRRKELQNGVRVLVILSPLLLLLAEKRKRG